MYNVEDFKIEMVDGSYVVYNAQYHQDIDFEKGGSIATLEQAEQVRTKLVELLNSSLPPETNTLEERLRKLEEENKLLKKENIETMQAVTTLFESIQGDK